MTNLCSKTEDREDYFILLIGIGEILQFCLFNLNFST